MAVSAGFQDIHLLRPEPDIAHKQETPLMRGSCIILSGQLLTIMVTGLNNSLVRSSPIFIVINHRNRTEPS